MAKATGVTNGQHVALNVAVPVQSAARQLHQQPCVLPATSACLLHRVVRGEHLGKLGLASILLSLRALHTTLSALVS